ncbi:MAG: hypothetical protein E6Q68_01760 [Polynucleobacter sp.]|nr:MAG: hypothetical protein E6Q68_01760 [Polynucleobacter sp.]
MLSESYMLMSPMERFVYIGKLVHAAQSDEKSFAEGQELIRRAEERGTFEGVTIMPQLKQEVEI